MLSSAARALSVLCLGALVAPARADVGLWPPEARAMGADEARAVRATVDVAREVLKGRLRVLAATELPADPDRCLAEATCRTELLGQLEVEELAAITLTPASGDGAFAVARLLVWTPEGVGFDASARLTGDSDLRALLTRALEPGRATARLDITGLTSDDVVLIDGLRSEPRALLASGEHTVVVLHADGTRTTLPLALAFEERRTLEVPRRLAPGEQAPTWPGLWPVVVGGSVAVVGGAGSVAGGLIGAGADDARTRDTAVAAAVASGVTGAIGLATVVIAFVTTPAPEVTP